MHHSIDRYVRFPEVRELTGLSRTTLYLGMATGTFPRNYALGQRARGWKASEVNRWIASRQPVDHVSAGAAGP